MTCWRCHILPSLTCLTGDSRCLFIMQIVMQHWTVASRCLLGSLYSSTHIEPAAKCQNVLGLLQQQFLASLPTNLSTTKQVHTGFSGKAMSSLLSEVTLSRGSGGTSFQHIARVLHGHTFSTQPEYCMVTHSLS